MLDVRTICTVYHAFVQVYQGRRCASVERLAVKRRRNALFDSERRAPRQFLGESALPLQCLDAGAART